MKVLNHECPTCGANILFNPEIGMWNCKYCGELFLIEDFKKYDDEIKKELSSNNADLNINMDEYRCQNCGAMVVTDENTIATTCVHCRSTAIIKSRLQGEYKPTKIIPFDIDKEKAIELIYKFIKKKDFVPKEFYNKKNFIDIRGIYIPFWLFDCNIKGKVLYSAKKTSSWISGIYKFTKTDCYDVYRSGSIKFDKIPVDGSIKFDDTMMNAIEPYDYKGLTDFKPSYMSGFFAEKYDVNIKESYTSARERIINSFNDKLKETIKGYTDVLVTSSNIDVEEIKSDYVLFPVWILNINYKNKIYNFAMNGQTGKVAGIVPVSIFKIIKILFFWFSFLGIMLWFNFYS